MNSFVIYNKKSLLSYKGDDTFSVVLLSLPKIEDFKSYTIAAVNKLCSLFGINVILSITGDEIRDTNLILYERC